MSLQATQNPQLSFRQFLHFLHLFIRFLGELALGLIGKGLLTLFAILFKGDTELRIGCSTGELEGVELDLVQNFDLDMFEQALLF